MSEGQSVSAQADAAAAIEVSGAIGLLRGAPTHDSAPHGRFTEQTEGRVVPLKAVPSRATSGTLFLDLRFDSLPLEEAAEFLVDRAARKAPFVYVVTPNVDHRVRLGKEPGLKPFYDAAWMTLCDSRILELMARFDGVDLRAAPGADLIERMFKLLIRPSDPVNVIGSTEDVIATVKARYGLLDLRWHQAPMDLRSSPAAIAEAAAFVANNPSRFTFICVGSPQQEIVAKAILESGRATGVGICCGASLEFLSGKVPRAPRWMRNMALEWLHRFATHPLRFAPRYLFDGPKIFPIWMRSRQRKDSDGDRGSAAPACGVDPISAHPAA